MSQTVERDYFLPGPGRAGQPRFLPRLGAKGDAKRGSFLLRAPSGSGLFISRMYQGTRAIKLPISCQRALLSNRSCEKPNQLIGPAQLVQSATHAILCLIINTKLPVSALTCLVTPGLMSRLRCCQSLLLALLIGRDGRLSSSVAVFFQQQLLLH